MTLAQANIGSFSKSIEISFEIQISSVVECTHLNPDIRFIRECDPKIKLLANQRIEGIVAYVQLHIERHNDVYISVPVVLSCFRVSSSVFYHSSNLTLAL